MSGSLSKPNQPPTQLLGSSVDYPVLPEHNRHPPAPTALEEVPNEDDKAQLEANRSQAGLDQDGDINVDGERDEPEDPQEEAKDKAEREELLRQGRSNRRTLVLEAAPTAIGKFYTKSTVISAFQKLWKKPQNPHPAALSALEQANKSIEAIVSRGPDGRNGPDEVAVRTFPIDNFLQFAVQVHKMALAISRGFDHEALQQTGVDRKDATLFFTENVPIFCIQFAEKGMPWPKYVGQEMFILLNNATDEEKRAAWQTLNESLAAQSISIKTLTQDQKELIAGESDLLDDKWQMVPASKQVVNPRQIKTMALKGTAGPAVQVPQTPKPPGQIAKAVRRQGQKAAPVTQLPGKPMPLPSRSLEINDDGNTFLGRVQHVMKVGNRGARVIVNEGTESFPYLSIHPGAEFGTGVARTWIETAQFNEQVEDMKIFKREDIRDIDAYVDVERTVEKTRRPQRPIRFYRVQLKNTSDDSRLTREHMYGESSCWLPRAQWLRLTSGKVSKYFIAREKEIEKSQDEHLLWLQICRKDGTHPDTGAPLSESDRESCPWLTQGFDDDDGDTTTVFADKGQTDAGAESLNPDTDFESDGLDNID